MGRATLSTFASCNALAKNVVLGKLADRDGDGEDLFAHGVVPVDAARSVLSPRLL